VITTPKAWSRICKEHEYDENDKYAKEAAKHLKAVFDVSTAELKVQLKALEKAKKPLATAAEKIAKNNSKMGVEAKKVLVDDVNKEIKSCNALLKPLDATAVNVKEALKLVKNFKSTDLNDYRNLYEEDAVRLIHMGLNQAKRVQPELKDTIEPIHKVFQAKMTQLDSGTIADDPTAVKMAAQGMQATLEELDKAAKGAKLWK